MLLFSIFPLSSLSCVLTRILVECHSEDESTNRAVLFKGKLKWRLERLMMPIDWGELVRWRGGLTWPAYRPQWELWKYYFIANRLVVTNNFSVPSVSWLRGCFLMEISLSARVDTCHTRKRPTLLKNRGLVSISIEWSVCFICDYPGLCFRRGALLPLSTPFDRITWCFGRRFWEHITLQSIEHITIEIIRPARTDHKSVRALRGENIFRNID